MSEYRQGVTLDTPHTRNWTGEQRQSNDFFESRHVFRNFHDHDQGRSRQLVCLCATPTQAAEVVRLLNEKAKPRRKKKGTT